MNMNIDDEKENLRNLLYDYEVELPAGDWQAIESRLPRGKVVPIISLWWRSVAAAVALLLVIGGGVWWSFKGDDIKEDALLADSTTQPLITPALICEDDNIDDVRVEEPTASVLSESGNQLKIASPKSVVDVEKTIHSASVIESAIEASESVAMIHEEPVKHAEESSEAPATKPQERQLSIEEAEILLAQQHAAQQEEIEQASLAKREARADMWDLGALASINPSSMSNLSSPSQPMMSGASQLGQKNVEAATKVRHDLPVTVGLQVGFNLVQNLDIRTGLSYTYLRSQFVTQTDGGSNKRVDNQMLHYLGIPVSLSYRFLNTKYVTLYVAAGGMIEQGISRQEESEITTSQGTVISHNRYSGEIKGIQWSVNGNIGAAVTIYKGMQIYVEPGVAWYIPNVYNPQPESQRTASPFNFNLQCGLRYTFGK